jgi:hypothetical protein
MLTKEEAAEIIKYCNEHNESYKKRLEELGSHAWKSYGSKRRYIS